LEKSVEAPSKLRRGKLKEMEINSRARGQERRKVSGLIAQPPQAVIRDIV
jgi:hypothetical protein